MVKVLLNESDSGVILVSINRPARGNRLDLDVLQCLQDVCENIAADEAVKVVIITGSGNSFCLGSESSMVKAATELSAASLISSIKCPVIAAINGDAFGEGLEIALACDIRICTPHAEFALPAVKGGQIPADGGTQRLPRIIGLPRAMEMILSAEEIDAKKALDTGLVSSIVEEEKLLPAAMAMGLEMANNSPLALGFAKEAISKGMDLTLEQGLRLEADLYFLLHTTEDRSEGIKSFREKRKPDFKGR